MGMKGIGDERNERAGEEREGRGREGQGRVGCVRGNNTQPTNGYEMQCRRVRFLQQVFGLSSSK